MKKSILVIIIIIVVIILGIIIYKNIQKHNQEVIEQESQQVSEVVREVEFDKIISFESGYNVEVIQEKMDEKVGIGKTYVYKIADEVFIRYNDTGHEYKANDYDMHSMIEDKVN